MGAKEGNQNWTFRKKHGRDHKFTPQQIWDEFETYRIHIQDNRWFKNEAIKSGDMAGTIVSIPMTTPMSIEGFCVFAEMALQTFYSYEKHDDFVEIMSHIRLIIENQQLEGAIVGAFNPNIIARKLGLSEKTDVTTNGESLNINKQPLTPEQIKKLNDDLESKY